ncbi:MAG: winged helix-turn-helix domain-containing protein [Gemmatimonadota bacterium]
MGRSRVRDRIDRRVPEAVVGRDREVESLLACLEPGGPVVSFVHGIPGIGKSALLQAFEARARTAGALVASVDGRSVEPSERGLIEHLAERLDTEAGSLEVLSSHLGQLDRTVVLAVDTFERLRLLDTWLRRNFVPGLPENARLVVAGRYPPTGRWLTRPGWEDLISTLHLGPLSDEAAVRLLKKMGVTGTRARRIHDFAGGHPLALKLAAATARHEGEPSFGDVGISRVVRKLSRYVLEEVEDPATREALVAASVVRRTTVTLLAALFPQREARGLHERLASLPFVYSGPDGLVVHDAVREAISAATRSHDPKRHRRYRRAAWKTLRTEVSDAGRSELWRYTADMLYLIENPIVREAFFPSGARELTVEPAAEDAANDLLSIARRHEGNEAVDLLRYWWRTRSHRFHSVFDAEGEVVGFYVMLPADEARAAPQDSVVQGWLEHLGGDGPDPGDTLFIRRWLSREDGEAPSPVQAACWLDIKRTYMEMRPELRRVYLTVRDLAPYAEVAAELGFEHVADLDRVVDDATYRTVCLDFGPASVDGWLRELAAAELGVDEEIDLVDHASRELLVGERRIALSSREYDVLCVLEGRAGEAVSRRELLDRVWGGGQKVASNVVDSVVYGLRQKLGDRADRLETVRGVGYRLRRG